MALYGFDRIAIYASQGRVGAARLERSMSQISDGKDVPVPGYKRVYSAGHVYGMGTLFIFFYSKTPGVHPFSLLASVPDGLTLEDSDWGKWEMTIYRLPDVKAKLDTMEQAAIVPTTYWRCDCDACVPADPKLARRSGWHTEGQNVFCNDCWETLAF